MLRSTLKKDAFQKVLTPAQQELLSNESALMKLNKGQMVFTEGSMPFGFYQILSGKVKLFKTGVYGKTQIFQICSGDDLFGYHPILSDSKYPDSAQLLEDSELIFIPKDVFRKVLLENNKLCIEILGSLSEEFARFIGFQTLLGQKTVSERVSSVLFYLSRIYKIKDEVIIPLSRTDLSDLCGTVKESLVRVLHDLKEEGALEVIDSQGTIRVLNISILKARGDIVDNEYL